MRPRTPLRDGTSTLHKLTRVGRSTRSLVRPTRVPYTFQPNVHAALLNDENAVIARTRSRSPVANAGLGATLAWPPTLARVRAPTPHRLGRARS